MAKNHSNVKRVEVQPVVQETIMNQAVVPTTPVVEVDGRYDEAHLQGLTTTSARIRYLHSRGLKNGEIAKKLGKLYQHVRNVLIVPVKVPRDSTPVNELKAVEPASQDEKEVETTEAE